ncbi:MAG: hypothetical protein ACTHJL_08060 [Amnibacterium sp.]
MHRALLACGAAAALLLSLAACSTTPTTGTVHGAFTLSAGAYDAPAGPATDASECVTHAQSDSDLADCETTAPAATQTVPCTATVPGVRPGAEVDLLDASGKVVGLGRLRGGRTTGSGAACTFPFTASGVPAGGGIYGVRLGPTGQPQAHFTKAELFGGPAVVPLG